jgi:ribokinase
MAQARTLKTELNVLAKFAPSVPEALKRARYCLLANSDPALQLEVLSQMERPAFTALDTMNFWISGSRKKLEEAISSVDAVFINDAEARQLCGTPSVVKAARKIMGMGPDFVIVKKGEHGALLFSDGKVFSAPAFPLEDVVDPTGAGDSFAGAAMGLIAKTGDSSEKNFRKAIIYGSAVASYNAEHFGVSKLKSLSLKEVEARVRSLLEISAF